MKPGRALELEGGEGGDTGGEVLRLVEQRPGPRWRVPGLSEEQEGGRWAEHKGGGKVPEGKA